MKTLCLVVAFCLACPYYILSRNLPSSSIRATLYKAIDLSYNNIDSALYLANSALSAAQKADSVQLIFSAYRTIGYIYETNNDLQKAQNAYLSALNLAQLRLKTTDHLTIYIDLAIVYKKLGQYSTAQDYYKKTIEQAEKIQDVEMIEDAYHGLGMLYDIINDYEQASQHYLHSIEIAEKRGNAAGVVISYKKISELQLKAQEYDKALQTIEKTYQMALALGDSLQIAAVLYTYGSIETAAKNYKAALEKLNQAKTVFERLNEKQCLTESFLAIGQVYYQIKNYGEAEQYFRGCSQLSSFLPNEAHTRFYLQYGELYIAQNKIIKALSCFEKSLILADKYSFKDISKRCHQYLKDIYLLTKNYPKALYHVDAIIQYDELLYKESQSKNQHISQFKFDIQQKNKEIETQKQALKLSKRAYTIFALLSFALLMLLLYTWQQVKAKQAATKNAQILLKELHHRVKNNMQTIASMMRIQAHQCQDPVFTAMLLENKNRFDTFAMLHQQLYKSDNAVDKVELQPFIHNIVERLRFSYGLNEQQFKANIELYNQDLDVDSALSIGLILNELLTNSFKYAYPTLHNKNLLEVTIQLSHNNFIYTDNGKVLHPDFDFKAKAGFGLFFIASSAQLMKSKYRFEVKQGLCFHLSFPENKDN